jgi:hypothetical protein
VGIFSLSVIPFACVVFLLTIGQVESDETRYLRLVNGTLRRLCQRKSVVYHRVTRSSDIPQSVTISHVVCTVSPNRQSSVGGSFEWKILDSVLGGSSFGFYVDPYFHRNSVSSRWLAAARDRDWVVVDGKEISRIQCASIWGKLGFNCIDMCYSSKTKHWSKDVLLSDLFL